jgi:hypothetical protein
MEQMMDTGNADALEALIDQASRTRMQWRMGTRKP